MTTYYVSAQRGNDSTNNGTSNNTPYATITKAVSMVAAGDTVYIGSGTYRETVSLVTSGTEVNPIKWIPDGNSKYLTSDNKGIVRITKAGTDEVPVTSARVIYFGTIAYNTFGSYESKCYIDGIYNYNTIRGETTATDQICINLVVTGDKVSRVTCIDCTITGGYMCFEECNCTNCIAIGAYYSFYKCTCTNCIGGGATAFYGSNTTNCTGFGSQNCFNLDGVTPSKSATNCLAFSSVIGFIGDSTTVTLTNCKAVYCYRGFYGTSSTNPLDISTCYYVGCITPYRTGGYTTDNATASKHLLCDFSNFKYLLQPFLQGVFDDGLDSVSVGDYDILGNARRLGDGSIDIGAIEDSNVSLEYTNYKTQTPAIKISRAGEKIFKFYADSGSAFTKKVWVKWSGYAGTNKPQLIATGAHITTQKATATGDGTTFEELSVSATPSASSEITLFLYARDTDASAVTYFSDLS